MANPSELHKGCPALHAEPRMDVTNYLPVSSSKVRPTRVEIHVLSFSTTGSPPWKGEIARLHGGKREEGYTGSQANSHTALQFLP